MPNPTFNIHIGEKEYQDHGLVHEEVVKCIREQPPKSWTPILKALSWIACAKRPLAEKELHDALAVRESDVHGVMDGEVMTGKDRPQLQPVMLV